MLTESSRERKTESNNWKKKGGKEKSKQRPKYWTKKKMKEDLKWIKNFKEKKNEYTKK